MNNPLLEHERRHAFERTHSEHVLPAVETAQSSLPDSIERLLCARPPYSRDRLARQTTQRQAGDGWLLTLELPSYNAVLTYADNRELRQEIYTADVTRASDAGPHAGRCDNGRVMGEIPASRHEVA